MYLRTHTHQKKRKTRASALVHVALTEVHGTRPYPRVSRKHSHPLHTGLYVVDLQGLKPPQSRSIPSILGCMSPTYRAWNHPKAPQRLQCFNKKNVNMRLCLKKRHPLERPKLRGIPCFLRHLVGPLDFITPYWTQLWHPSFVGVCVYIYIYV